MKVWGCRLTDDSALERAKGRAVRPFMETADPWLTEARVVAAHGALHKAQVCHSKPAYTWVGGFKHESPAADSHERL